MSARSRAGKAVWAARATTYRENLAQRIVDDAAARMDVWTARGRVPARVRVMARLAGRPVWVDDAGSRR